jgi:hypothetical protein
MTDGCAVIEGEPGVTAQIAKNANVSKEIIFDNQVWHRACVEKVSRRQVNRLKFTVLVKDDEGELRTDDWRIRVDIARSLPSDLGNSPHALSLGLEKGSEGYIRHDITYSEGGDATLALE